MMKMMPTRNSLLDNGIPLFAAVIVYSCLIFAQKLFNDGDTFWHIAAGQWILDHGSAPRADPFSYSFAGAPWTAHEWLSEVLMALAYRAAGWNGVLLLAGFAAAATAGLLAIHLGRYLRPLPRSLVLYFGLICCAGSLLARPHLLALPALELWTAGLLVAAEERRAPSYWLLPVMTVWANLHGSFVLGLALTAPFAADALARSEAGDRIRLARRWALFAGGAVGAALLTPRGVHGLIFPFQLMAMKSLAGIGEWRSTDFSTNPPLEISLLLALFHLFSRGIRISPVRAIVLIGLLYLALHHARNQIILGIVAPLVLAEPLARAADAGNRASERMKAIGQRSAGLLTAVFVVAACVTVIQLNRPLGPADTRAFPSTALSHVPQELVAAPVLNAYDFGGALIFEGIKPFIDGRTDLYGDDFVQDYFAISGGDPAKLETALQRYRVQWTIFETNSIVAKMLDNMPGWRRLYSDGIAVIHVRNAQPRGAPFDFVAEKTPPISTN